MSVMPVSVLLAISPEHAGRLADRDWKRWNTLWIWCAIRFASPQQNRFYAKHGHDATIARINRVRRRVGLGKI